MPPQRKRIREIAEKDLQQIRNIDLFFSLPLIRVCTFKAEWPRIITVGGERSTLLHFKALRLVLAQASEQNACPEEQTANYERGWTPFSSALPVHTQAKINPAVILHEAHTTHMWSSKDKALIKQQRERRRKRESFPKQICKIRLLTADQQANSDRKTNKHNGRSVYAEMMSVCVYNVPLCQRDLMVKAIYDSAQQKIH